MRSSPRRLSPCSSRAAIRSCSTCPRGGATACWGRRATTPLARRSTRSPHCWGSGTPAARRSSGSRPRGGGDPARFTFPRPMIDEGLEFSFSGLKTAVLHAVRASADVGSDRASLARGFQDAVLDVLVTKLERAVDATGRQVAVLGGGVACSRALAALAARRLAGRARVAVASPRLNADNAAMIARAGWWRLAQGEASDWTLDARADLPLAGLEPFIPQSAIPNPQSP